MTTGSFQRASDILYVHNSLSTNQKIRMQLDRNFFIEIESISLQSDRLYLSSMIMDNLLLDLSKIKIKTKTL